MQKKSEAIKQVRRFVAKLNRLASTRSGKPVRIVGHLHVDNAGEFLSREFKDFLDSELIENRSDRFRRINRERGGRLFLNVRGLRSGLADPLIAFSLE